MITLVRATVESPLHVSAWMMVLPLPRRSLAGRLERAKQDLHRAVVVTAVGDFSWVSIEDVANMLAAKFDLVPGVLDIRCSGLIEFLVFMADEESVINLSNSNNELTGNGVVRLHCRWWTSHPHASGGALPALVGVELRGAPTHTWEASTAESLLNPYGWVLQVHENTKNHEDYSAFCVSAWCFSSMGLPPSCDLIIVKPSVGAEEEPSIKRTLVYKVQFECSAPTTMEEFPPTPPDSDDGEERRTRHHRHTSPVPEPAAATADAPATGIPAMDRVGDSASEDCHVVAVVEVDSSPPGWEP